MINADGGHSQRLIRVWPFFGEAGSARIAEFKARRRRDTEGVSWRRSNAEIGGPDAPPEGPGFYCGPQQAAALSENRVFA